MNAEQFQELYKMLRGSRAALMVLDARALFMEKKPAKAMELLQQARDSFAESRSRTLKQTPEQQVDAKARDADRQLRKLKRKQDKTLEALEAFDELLPQLQKFVDRHQRKLDLEASVEKVEAVASEHASGSENTDEPARGDEAPPADAMAARPSDLPKPLLDQLAQAEPDRRLDLINDSFGFREVRSEQDLHGEALYYVQTEKAALLVCTPPADEIRDSIQLTSILDQRPIKPFSRSAFLKLGADHKMVLLTRRETADQTVDTAPNAPPSNGQTPKAPADHQDSAEQQDPAKQQDSANQWDSAEQRDSAGAANQSRGAESALVAGAEAGAEENTDATTDEHQTQQVLDLGAFSQLLTSAQRSGLVPDAEQVGYVRDREFRQGKYDLAFQTIDTMYSRFLASAGQRTQRLAREDADIAAGRIKMSPKDLQAKRARDRTQTQEVDRAKRRFQVVLEGLRILMNTES